MRSPCFVHGRGTAWKECLSPAQPVGAEAGVMVRGSRAGAAFSHELIWIKITPRAVF